MIIIVWLISRVSGNMSTYLKISTIPSLSNPSISTSSLVSSSLMRTESYDNALNPFGEDDDNDSEIYLEKDNGTHVGEAIDMGDDVNTKDMSANHPGANSVILPTVDNKTMPTQSHKLAPSIPNEDDEDDIKYCFEQII